MAELGAPIGFLRVLKDLCTLPVQQNAIKDSYPAEQRTVRISKDISVNSIKCVAKKLKATVFEICHTMVS
jgi:hypothetical protein